MPERVPQDTLRYGRLLTCLLKRLHSQARAGYWPGEG
jgi:hypothetical protein